MPWLAVAVLSMLTLPAAALAADPPNEESEKAVLSIPFEKYTLDNGLEVILSVDRKLPVVAVNVWYHVGAFHEQPGRTGFAHLFEHMMFQGSKNVEDDVHISLLQQIGATDVNGTTNFDRTNYFQTVPAHHLETALWLESDRMGFLLDALTPEKLDNQREVVKNERRQRTDAAPYGLASEKAWQALFPLPHPYYGSVIGSMEDLDAATMEDVFQFFEKWYAPSNATLAIVGDIDVEETKKLVERYFGSLPSRPKPESPRVEDVALNEEVVIRMEEPVATLPLVLMYWHSPRIFTEGDATADIVASALGTGKASRLYQRLIYEKKLAQSVSAYQYSLGAQSAFGIEVVARPGKSTDEIVAEVDAVLAELRENGVTDEEIRRARNRFETRRLLGLQRVGGFGGKADMLQSYNHFLGDPGKLAWDLQRYELVTTEETREFARTILAPDRRVVLHAIPPASRAGGAE
ncbi:MAG: pitrilysin family protein [Pseudomonadota bacterium]|nr:MAG: insulinase family protein [Pseudomonadota bacterium]